MSDGFHVWEEYRHAQRRWEQTRVVLRIVRCFFSVVDLQLFDFCFWARPLFLTLAPMWCVVTCIYVALESAYCLQLACASAWRWVLMRTVRYAPHASKQVEDAKGNAGRHRSLHEPRTLVCTFFFFSSCEIEDFVETHLCNLSVMCMYYLLVSSSLARQSRYTED